MVFFKYTCLLLLLNLSGISFGDEPKSEKPLVVVVPSYNNLDWYEENLSSIFMQKYSNYRVVYIDDCSPDGTGDAVKQYVRKVGQQSRFTLIKNPKRLGSPLANHYQAIVNHCDDDEIVLCLDGDDWLAHERVFSIINNAYSTEDIWATHGTLQEYPQGVVSWSIPIPENVIALNKFRHFRCPSHLKTFYAWLFKQIKVEDLMYNGEFFLATGDQAMMFPIIEMAGKRHKFIPNILYIYNMSNPFGESIVATQLQRDMEQEVRNREPYQPLEEKPE